MKFKLIYFDDVIANIELYQDILSEEFEVFGTTNCSCFSDLMIKHQPQAILIDLHMPEMNGVELCGKILTSDSYNDCPIFFISGDESDEGRLKSLSIGAVDFLSRFLPADELKVRLMSKIKFFLQRTPCITIGNLRLDKNLFMTFVDEKPIDLTLIEMRILSFMVRNLPHPATKVELLQAVWGESSCTGEGKIKVHVSNLNLKLSGWGHTIKMKDDLVFVSSL
jgi:DNA-binding response OmpR family regulator